MSTIFTKIINGEIPAFKVAETEDYLAFLDINPVAVGHTLCIPKKEVDYIFDLDDQLLAGLHVFAKKVAIAIEKEVSCERVGVAVVGLEVPHAHVHLLPLNSMQDINFSKPKLTIEQDKLDELAEKIRSHIDL